MRRPVGALVAATRRSISWLDLSPSVCARQAAAGQSGDRSPHSKGLKLISKVLRHHQAAHTAIHDAKANAPEFGS